MAKFFLTVFLFIELFSQNTFAQNQLVIDSLYNTLKNNTLNNNQKALNYSKIAEEFYFSKPDSAIKHCYKGLIFSKKENNTTDIAYFYSFLGVLYKNKNQYDSAIHNLNKSIEYNKLDGFERGIAGNLNNLGQVFRLKGNYEKALIYYTQSLQIFKKHNDTLNIGELHSNIGAVFMKLNEFKQAEEHFKLSQTQYKLAKANLQEAWILFDLGNLKLKTGSLDSAKTLFMESSKIWKKFNRPKEFNTCQLRIGEILIQKKQFNEAEITLRKASKEFEKIKNAQLMGEAYVLIGKSLYFQNKNNEALKLLFNAQSINDSIKASHLEMDIYFELYKNFKKLKDNEQALIYNEKYHEIKDSVYKNDKSELIAEYQTRLNVMNKESIIKQLEHKSNEQIIQNTLISRENRQKQISIYILVIAISIILFIVYIIFKRNKTINTLNGELRKSLKEREILIKEVHHRVKNNLQIISSLLNLQSENIENANPKELLQISMSRIEAMSMIHENLYKSTHLSQINFNKYISNLCNYISTSFHIESKGIQLKHSIEEIQVSIDQMVPCGLIINELITNSIKHAFTNTENNLIQINCYLENDWVNIEIYDNGKGLTYDTNQKSKSIGLRLSKGLAKQLHSELIIENRQGVFAHFKFKPHAN